ncbi:vomeronasal type-1 receptor 90 [Ictidomys tridecemlineatus]
MRINKNSQASNFTHIRNMLFSEVSIGIGANTALLLFHILMFLLKHRLKPIDLTISHLALVHLVMLLSVGFIAADIFGYQDLGNDFSCKSVISLHRLMRGLSICTTCLLSVLQAVTLSPRNSCLAKFKGNSSPQSMCCFLFFWVFNMLISGRFLIAIIATPNITTLNLMFVTKSCSLQPIGYLFRYTFFSLVTFRDVSFIGLMALSSGYMVTLLCRHKRQCQHLHSTSLSPKASPEHRATRTILLLMGFFVVMYVLDFAISSYSGMLWNSDNIHHCVQMLVGNGYATVSSLVLIGTEKQMRKFSRSLWGKLTIGYEHLETKQDGVTGTHCASEKGDDAVHTVQDLKVADEQQDGLKVGQPGATGADSDGLKHTQDKGSADGQPPHDLVQEDKYFAFEVTWNVLCFPNVCGHQKAHGDGLVAKVFQEGMQHEQRKDLEYWEAPSVWIWQGLVMGSYSWGRSNAQPVVMNCRGPGGPLPESAASVSSPKMLSPSVSPPHLLAKRRCLSVPSVLPCDLDHHHLLRTAQMLVVN